MEEELKKALFDPNYLWDECEWYEVTMLPYTFDSALEGEPEYYCTTLLPILEIGMIRNDSTYYRIDLILQ